MNLEDALKVAAHKVWDELEPLPVATGVRVFQEHEAALTTMALKALWRTNCPEVVGVVMTPPAREVLEGHDFILCVGDEPSRTWIRYFVQAKKLTTPNAYGRYTVDAQQCDDLRDYALSQFRLGQPGIPMYALYNHLTDSQAHIRPYYQYSSVFDPRDLGITVTSILTMTSALGTTPNPTFDQLHSGDVLRHANPFFFFSPMVDAMFHAANDAGSGIPFHALADFSIEWAQWINQQYRAGRFRRKLPFFFFGLPQFMDGDGDPIPILKDYSPARLIEDFQVQSRPSGPEKSAFSPVAIVIIQQSKSAVEFFSTWLRARE